MGPRHVLACALLGACANAPLGLLDGEGGPGARVSLKFPEPERVAEAPAAQPTGKMSLSDAYRLALERSEQVAITEAQVDNERYIRRANRDLISPTATLQGIGIGRRKITQEGMDGMGNTFTSTIQSAYQTQAELKVSQPVYRRGGLSLLDAGDRGIEAARELNKREQQTLAHDVALAYVSVLRTRKLVDLAKLDAERAKVQLDAAVLRSKSGNALKNAELQARVDLKRAEQSAVASNRDARVAEATFARLVGQAPPPEMSVPPEPSLLPADKSLALAHERPDIVALVKREEQAHLIADVFSKRRWFPRVDLVGTVDYYEPEPLTVPFSYAVQGTITIPIFEANQHTDALARANDLRIAELNKEYQLRLVDEDVASAIAQVIGSQDASKLAEEQLAAAKDLYALVDKQFKASAVTYIEVTNAQTVLVGAENAYEVSNMDRISAIYEYLYATGAIDLSTAK